MIFYLITEGLAFHLFTDFSSQAPLFAVFGGMLPCFRFLRYIFCCTASPTPSHFHHQPDAECDALDKSRLAFIHQQRVYFILH